MNFLIFLSAAPARIGSGVIALVLGIYPVFKSVEFFKKKDHENRVNVVSYEFTGKEYKQNVPQYTNGCYYLYFSSEIKVEKYTVASLEISTYVYTLSEEKLGYIKSTFDDIPANSNTKYNLTLADNQPFVQGHELFLKLWQGGYSDFRFMPKITYIRFSDNTFIDYS